MKSLNKKFVFAFLLLFVVAQFYSLTEYAFAATASDNIIITLDVDSGITISDCADVTMAPNISVSANGSIGSSTCTVKTNNVTGYTLAVKSVKSEVATVNMTGAAGGTSGYVVGDILTLATPPGGRAATVTVATESSGVVTAVTLRTKGVGYTTGIKATTGGSGTGLVEVNVATLDTVANPALTLQTDITKFFADYTEGTPGTPEVWSVASGDKEFGYSAYGTDTATGTWGTGDSCGSAGAPTGTAKYVGLLATDKTVATRSSVTPFAGIDTTLCFAAEQNAVYADSGRYTAVVTATATTL